MAQLGSALSWGGRGREFESLHTDHLNQYLTSNYKTSVLKPNALPCSHSTLFYSRELKFNSLIVCAYWLRIPLLRCRKIPYKNLASLLYCSRLFLSPHTPENPFLCKYLNKLLRVHALPQLVFKFMLFK